MIPEISAVALSAKNPKVKRLRRLVAQRKVRSQERTFVVEGPLLVSAALAAELTVSELFVGAEGLASYPELSAALTKSKHRPEVYTLDTSVLESLLDSQNPRPVACLVEWPDLSCRDRAPIVALWELRDPGNLGTILRTAEAAGYGGVVLVGDCVDVFSPKVVRASAGSVLRMPIVAVETMSELLAFAQSRNAKVLAADSDSGAIVYDTCDLTRAVVLLGNESHGLDAVVLQSCDQVITIPVEPAVESLNVAAAAAVLCFESARQSRLSMSERDDI